MLLIVIVLWGYSINFVEWQAPEESDRGTFGDQFGAINALFSGLAFAGLIYTILLQREELQAQREELGHTRDEIKKQREELEQQNETLALQRFENSFFNIISEHNKATSYHVHRTHGIHNVGKKAIDLCEEEFHKEVYKEYSVVKQQGRVAQASLILNKHLPVVIENFPFISFYFRSLFMVFNYLKNQEFSWEQKNVYIELILSQLSDGEVQLMFLYGITSQGKKFRELIEQLGLLRDIRTQPNTFYDDYNKNNFYSEKAFNLSIPR